MKIKQNIKEILVASFNLCKKRFERRSTMDFPSCIRVQTPEKTLEACKNAISNKVKGAYLRFGDGDINLLEGKNDMMQESNEGLSREMKEVFELYGEGIIKCLPIHSHKFGIVEGMKPGVHSASDEWSQNILSRIYKYFIGDYIYSPVALAYLSVFDTNYTIEFLRYLKSKNPIFVGNSEVPSTLIKSLFGDTVHIKTPPKQSFYEIDRIEKETLSAIKERKNEYEVVILAMGCSGRVLQKRILKNAGFQGFLFDFGSLLDILCGWNTRAWIELAEVSEDHWKQLVEKVGK